MSTLKRLGDVSIHIHEAHRTISCPFALGPLELKVQSQIHTNDLIQILELWEI